MNDNCYEYLRELGITHKALAALIMVTNIGPIPSHFMGNEEGFVEAMQSGILKEEENQIVVTSRAEMVVQSLKVLANNY